ncbi:hypothetical protein DKG75_19605 [Zavarzinia compransoris]|uniref:Uncharacterized protein n=1 Tax=Zavarzinia compransoris TaxID=1264899 RepID=A0A317E1K1_9PROT|nr:hypothetical protein DKG75_19605 [Zavarzinia compransoris]
MEFIIDNGDTLLAAASGVIAAASAIAALTPTPVDDGIVRLLRRVVEVLALNVGNARRGP